MSKRSLLDPSNSIISKSLKFPIEIIFEITLWSVLLENDLIKSHKLFLSFLSISKQYYSMAMMDSSWKRLYKIRITQLSDPFEYGKMGRLYDGSIDTRY